MSDPFIAEIRIFPFDFAPQGWATCDGQLVPISQNTGLFVLLGTTYGGDGETTFALPNLQGSVPVQQGQGPGLQDYVLGARGGTDTVTLLPPEMASHAHALMASQQAASGTTPSPQMVLANASTQAYINEEPIVALASEAIAPAGANQPHNNLQPYLTMNFCISMRGIFPQGST